MSKVWKIAPGDNANDWDIFRVNDCIGIGWLPESDYRDFVSVSDALDALEAVHGPKAAGNGKGAAKMMLLFDRDIEIGDIVVANNAYNEVVGVGIIQSEYIPPNSRKNPLKKDDTTHRHHIRLVDWQITRTAYVPGKQGKKYFFVQQTLKQLQTEEVNGIIQAYVNAYPSDRSFAKKLKSIFALSSVPKPFAPKPSAPKANALVKDLDLDGTVSIKGEGRKRLVKHIVRERDSKIVKAKKDSAKTLECEVCGFDAEAFYGIPYCEVHHRIPLADLEEGTKTKIEDLAIVCANCHRIIHSKYPPISVEQLRKKIGR